jgi:hypothetical protein
MFMLEQLQSTSCNFFTCILPGSSLLLIISHHLQYHPLQLLMEHRIELHVPQAKCTKIHLGKFVQILLFLEQLPLKFLRPKCAHHMFCTPAIIIEQLFLSSFGLFFTIIKREKYKLLQYYYFNIFTLSGQFIFFF